MAAAQDGIVTRDQLRALGLGRGAIEHRMRRGVLHVLHRQVYQWGIPMDSQWTAARAAALACGAGAAVSHHASAGLYEIRRQRSGPVDVTVVGRRVRLRGIRAHAAAALDPADIKTLRGIAVTAPARTLLDLAGELTAPELAAAVEQAQIKRLATKREIAAAIERTPRRAGVQALRALFDEPAFTRSKAERRLVALLRAAQLSQPEFNACVEGFEVDALWRRERVVLEFDSYAFHAGPRAAFERDGAARPRFSARATSSCARPGASSRASRTR